MTVVKSGARVGVYALSVFHTTVHEENTLLILLYLAKYAHSCLT